MPLKTTDNLQSRIRWIRPVWLDWPQAVAYASLPPYVLREMAFNRLLRTQNFPRRGRLINRDSLDEILTRSVRNQQPICWGERRKK
jgi:hypothetical protein